MTQDDVTRGAEGSEGAGEQPEPGVDAPPLAAEDDGALDLTGLNEAISVKIDEPDLNELISSPERSTAEHDSLEEIAEDMLDLLTRVRALEDTQRQVLAGVDALGVQMAASATTHGRELHALRQDVVGDRKALAGLNMFNTVVQKLDPFRQMRAGLDEQKDERMCAQLDGLIASLEQLLRSSGFTPFHAAAGERFDPARMECVGYEQGEPDVVLAQVRCGYEAGTTLARPVGVLIAPPQAPSHEESTEQSVDQPEGEES